jgi:AcrR family transcriptional regulator
MPKLATIKNLQAVKTNSSRQRISKVATQLICERGYTATSVSLIARRSRLPVSSLYWHFKSKEGLLIDIIQQGAEQWLRLIPDWSDLHGSTLERLQRFLGENARLIRERPELVRILLTEYLNRANLSREAVRTIQGLRQAALDKVRPAIAAVVQFAIGRQDDRLAEELTGLCLACLNGCFIEHQINSERFDLNRRMEELAVALIAVAKEHGKACDTGISP